MDLKSIQFEKMVITHLTMSNLSVMNNWSIEMNDDSVSNLSVLKQVILIHQEANRLTGDDFKGDNIVEAIALGFDSACVEFLNVISKLENEDLE